MSNTAHPLSVSLPPQMAKWVSDRVNSGQYESADDLIAEALRVLRERDRDREADLGRVRAKIESGLAQARRGELLDGEDVFDQLERHGEAMAKPGPPPAASKLRKR